MSENLRLCLFGAATDSGNLGVSALALSTLDGIARRCPTARITMFDGGWGLRIDRTEVSTGRFSFERCGARLSKRYHRPESFFNMRVSGWLGLNGNAGLRRIREANGVLDFSGGDSFTDLYGSKRYRAVMMCKLIALEQGAPLILMPQTYGPFSDDKWLRRAARVIRRARAAWARDLQSYDRLRHMLGADFDEDRHRCGVDVAFALETRAPVRGLGQPVTDWLEDSDTVGINVSGLIYNDPAAAAAQYGLRANYRRVILGLIDRLLTCTKVRVLLVPHVVTPESHFESDIAACRDVLRRMASDARGRLEMVSVQDDPRCIKWVIARTNWFCGTRMHATIAGLSSGVATAAISYSLKTAGVFETCGQQTEVADPRRLMTEEVIEQLWSSFLRRNESRAALRERMPAVIVRAEEQFDQILQCCCRSDKHELELAP